LVAEKDRQAAERTRAASSISLVNLSLLAFVVGIVTGLGAVLFRDLIGLIHNAFFLGKFSLHYDANL
jgi:CIC family chloride channel protein